MFANMYLAYETLSDGMQRMLDGLIAVNSRRQGRCHADARGPRAATARARRRSEEYVAEHPVVRTHPETGRKALYVNRGHTLRFEDMTEDESAPLLQLSVRAPDPARVHLPLPLAAGLARVLGQSLRQHNPVNDYHGYRRVMHRVTLGATARADGARGRAPILAPRGRLRGRRSAGSRAPLRPTMIRLGWRRNFVRWSMSGLGMRVARAAFAGAWAWVALGGGCLLAAPAAAEETICDWPCKTAYAEKFVPEEIWGGRLPGPLPAGWSTDAGVRDVVAFAANPENTPNQGGRRDPGIRRPARGRPAGGAARGVRRPA